jgi:hypothetical protein
MDKKREEVFPLSAEQWQRVPGWLKWKIAIILLA